MDGTGTSRPGAVSSYSPRAAHSARFLALTSKRRMPDRVATAMRTSPSTFPHFPFDRTQPRRAPNACRASIPAVQRTTLAPEFRTRVRWSLAAGVIAAPMEVASGSCVIAVSDPGRSTTGWEDVRLGGGRETSPVRASRPPPLGGAPTTSGGHELASAGRPATPSTDSSSARNVHRPARARREDGSVGPAATRSLAAGVVSTPMKQGAEESRSPQHEDGRRESRAPTLHRSLRISDVCPAVAWSLAGA